MRKLLLLILISCRLHGAIALVAHTAAQAASPTLTITTSNITTTGATLLTAVVAGSSFSAIDPCTFTVSDTLANTWSHGTKQTTSPTKYCLFYSYNKAGSAISVGTDAITVNGTSITLLPGVEFAAWSGTLGGASSPFDQENGTATTVVSSLGTGSITPSTSGCLIVSGAGLRSSTTYTTTLTLLDSLDWVTASKIGVAAAYSIQTTATTVSDTWGMAGNGEMAVGITSFKPLASAAVTHRRVTGE